MTVPIATPHPASLTPATLAELRIDWQSVASRETRRGREKIVVTGIPGPAFWHAYRTHAAFRATCRALGITLNRVGKKQWEALAWLNRHTLPLFVAGTTLTLPDALPSAPSKSEPF